MGQWNVKMGQATVGTAHWCSWPGYQARTHTHRGQSKVPGVPEGTSCTRTWAQRKGEEAASSRNQPWRKEIFHYGWPQSPWWEASLPINPWNPSWSICMDINSGLSPGTVSATTYAVNSDSNLSQHQSVHIGITINCTGESLDFFKELSISGFENHCNIAKQISTGLEIEIKGNEPHIPQKLPPPLLFSYRNFHGPIINK